jgi:hypothetical protein
MFFRIIFESIWMMGRGVRIGEGGERLLRVEISCIDKVRRECAVK